MCDESPSVTQNNRSCKKFTQDGIQIFSQSNCSTSYILFLEKLLPGRYF